MPAVQWKLTNLAKMEHESINGGESIKKVLTRMDRGSMTGNV